MGGVEVSGSRPRWLSGTNPATSALSSHVGKLPHSLPLCNTFLHMSDSATHIRPLSHPQIRSGSGFLLGGELWDDRLQVSGRLVQVGALHAELRDRRSDCTPSC